jgi:plastocyanin
MWNLRKAPPHQRSIRLVLGGAGVAALLAAAIPAIGAGGAAVVAAAARTASIKIDNFAFTPPDLAIAAGTTVTWKNDDGEVHRVTDDHKGFSSAALDTDDSFSHTFATPGVYHYFCSIHPYMIGKIVVKPGGSGS